MIFSNDLLIRVPSLPAQTNFSEEQIKTNFGRKESLEAMYISSKDVYNNISKWLNKELGEKEAVRLFITLYKYSLRMANRSTPFGLLAGIGYAKWNDSNTEILVKEFDLRKKSTKIDSYYLSLILRKIEDHPEYRNHINYYPNNTIWENDSKIQFTEWIIKNEKK
ncbi:lantibiotic dehydratase, partial [Xanthovirga aplysinae]|uniref:lantibiotic dehydratase n=1 Tax=Xanthovirga aplysinae TaxID=2529853 RepID=UPI001CA3C0A8